MKEPQVGIYITDIGSVFVYTGRRRKSFGLQSKEHSPDKIMFYEIRSLARPNPDTFYLPKEMLE